MKTLTSADLQTLNLAIEYAIVTLGKEETIELLNSENGHITIVKNFTDAYVKFYEKIAANHKQITSNLAGNTYLNILTKEYKNQLHANRP